MSDKQLAGYFGLQVSSYGEQLDGLLLHQTHVGHDVALSDPCRRTKGVLQCSAVTLRCFQGAAYGCEVEKRVITCKPQTHIMF